MLASFALQTGDAGHVFPEAQVYAVVSERDVAGTGFLIDFEDETFAVTSVNAHDGSPTSLIGPDHAEVQLGPRVYSQPNVQIFHIERRLTDSSAPLTYRGPPALEPGERLAVVTLYGVVTVGTLRGPQSARVFEMLTETPVHAPEASGSPVLSVDSGSVVGVVTEVDDEERVNVFTFETMRFDGVEALELTDEMFVGSWVTGSGAMVTEVTFERNGSFVAKFFVGTSFVGKVGGLWKLQPEWDLVWTYDKDNGLIPSDQEDRNGIVRFSSSQFSVRESDGSLTVFTRK